MSDYKIDRSHKTAASLAADLEAAGVTLPDDVQVAMDALRAMLERQPKRPEDDAVTAAYLAGASDREASDLAAAVTSFPAAWEGWAGARHRLARRASRTITGHADEIIAQLQGIAEPIIDRLTAASQMASHDVGALLRANDREGAEVAAHVEHHAGELSAIYGLRARISQRAADYGRAGWWRHPRKITEAEAAARHHPDHDGGAALHRRAARRRRSMGAHPRRGAGRSRGRRRPRRRGEPDRAAERAAARLAELEGELRCGAPVRQRHPESAGRPGALPEDR